VPIRTNVAVIGISLFTGLISFADHIYGKARAKRVHVWKRVNKWRESRKFIVCDGFGYGSDDDERMPTCRHPPK
jgi:hypothetical protein